MADHIYDGPPGYIYPSLPALANQPEPGGTYDVPVNAVRHDPSWRRVADKPPPKRRAARTDEAAPEPEAASSLPDNPEPEPEPKPEQPDETKES